jgi:hypothetical protein
MEGATVSARVSHKAPRDWAGVSFSQMHNSPRPEMAVPSAPLQGFSRLIWQSMVPNKRGFRQAACVTLATGVAAVLLGVASFVLPRPSRTVVAYAAAAFAIYLMIRVIALPGFERRQRLSGTEWLAARTRTLREHSFEMVRIVLGGDDYDPARAEDVRRLRDGDGRERVTLIFIYLAADGTLTLERVHRELRDVEVRLGWAAHGRAYVQFPEARYLPEPEPGHHAARRARWSLDGPVVVAVSASDTATASGAGTRSSR